MTISFNQTPNNLRIPFMAVEFDSTNAIRGAQFQPYQALLLGQKLSSGNAVIGKPVRVNGESDAVKLFGAGSMLTEMVIKYRLVDRITELWAVPVPDDSAGVAATATATISGMVSYPGAIFVYVNGSRLTVPVKMGDSSTTIAAAFAAAVNAKSDLIVTAEASEAVVTLTARHKGEASNHIDLRLNYNAGESLPSGLAVGLTEFSGGVANPDVTDAVAAVAGEWFNSFICPYTDLNNLAVLNADMERRWHPLTMQDAWLFAAIRGSHGELGEFGQARNSKHEVISHCHGVPNSPWAFAASVAGNAMFYGNIDPARPFQTLPLVGILPPAVEDRFNDFPENNQLLYDGISTFTCGSDGVVRIGRLVTTYKTNERGADDTAYLDLNTGLTLSYIRWDFRNHMLRKFPRHKLGNDGVRYSSGQAIVTPMLAKAECIVKARDWEERGLIENVDQFKKELVVERNPSDPNRLDFLMTPDLMNQFIVGAAKVQFYL